MGKLQFIQHKQKEKDSYRCKKGEKNIILLSFFSFSSSSYSSSYINNIAQTYNTPIIYFCWSY